MHPWLDNAYDLIHPARSATHVRRTAEQQRAVAQEARHLQLYHFNSCPYCLRVRRAVDRLDIPIALRDIQADPEARRELIAGGGRRTVPCLYIDDGKAGVWLYESADIIDYLGKRFAPGQ